jgi:choline dehydrogenase-like flavoprotein
VNLNIKAKAENTFDAIVIGSGMTGGWAAKELCEKGLKTLVLERGRHVERHQLLILSFWNYKKQSGTGD